MTDDSPFTIAAELALELVASAYGRGEGAAGPDDPIITAEARAIEAIRKGDVGAMRRSLAAFQGVRKAEADELERSYGRPQPGRTKA